MLPSQSFTVDNYENLETIQIIAQLYKTSNKIIANYDKQKAPFQHRKELRTGGEGFEPPHMDPESTVLPLDEPPRENSAEFYHLFLGLSNRMAAFTLPARLRRLL